MNMLVKSSSLAAARPSFAEHLGPVSLTALWEQHGREAAIAEAATEDADCEAANQALFAVDDAIMKASVTSLRDLLIKVRVIEDRRRFGDFVHEDYLTQLFADIEALTTAA